MLRLLAPAANLPIDVLKLLMDWLTVVLKDERPRLELIVTNWRAVSVLRELTPGPALNELI